jgi:hypothetical protein
MIESRSALLDPTGESGPTGEPSGRWTDRLDRDEVDLLADPAVRAAPVIGNLRPRRARGKSLARLAGGFVIDVVADLAPVTTHALDNPRSI